ERHVRSQCRKIFEEKCVLEFVAQNTLGKFLDVTIAIDEGGGCFFAQPRYSWIAIGGIADEGKVIRNVCGTDAVLGADKLFIAHFTTPAIHLYDAIRHYALGEILVGRPNAHFLNPRVGRSNPSGRCERVVSFELDHWPCDDTHCRETFLEGN